MYNSNPTQSLTPCWWKLVSGHDIIRLGKTTKLSFCSIVICHPNKVFILFQLERQVLEQMNIQNNSTSTFQRGSHTRTESAL